MQLKILSIRKLFIVTLLGFAFALIFATFFSLSFITIHAQGSDIFTKTLKIGMKGDQVKHLQEILGDLAVDSSFGPKTKSAVMRFQKKEGIVADGIVGPITRAKLNKFSTGGVISPTDTMSPTGVTPETGSLNRTGSADTTYTTLPIGQVSSGLPIRLKIPKINVDDFFEYVGLTSDGAMDVPKGPKGVAWFNLGPRPGGIGSAVISGHSGWRNNIPAVFDNLYKLEKGDKIYVEDEKGATIIFVVREIRKYDPNADAGDVFGSSDGKAHLNLITCTGVWNDILKSRSERLVVFTDKEIQ